MKNKKTPLVSIGFPVHNGNSIKKNKFCINISESLKSILNQSYSNIEIIISDNASTDGTSEIIKNLCKNDSRVKYFKQPKILPSVENFNFVFNKSSGEYFKWSCHDDCISENFIEENLQFLENNSEFSFSSSPCFFDYNFTNKKNKLKFNFDLSTFERIKNFHKISSFCHSLFYGLIRKKNLDKTTDFSKNYWAMDWIIVLELLLEGKFKTIDNGHIIIGSGGASSNVMYTSSVAYNNKKIYYFIPFYELNLIIIGKIFKSKTIRYLEKFLLSYLSIKLNASYFRKKLKKTLEKYNS